MTEKHELDTPPLAEITDPHERETHIRALFRDLHVFGTLDEAAAKLAEMGVSTPAIVELFRRYAERLEADKVNR